MCRPPGWHKFWASASMYTANMNRVKCPTIRIRLIHLASDPEEYYELVQLSDLEANPRQKLLRHVKKFIAEE